MRVRQMILSANHVRDLHLYIVNNNRKIVERMTIGAQQHQVFDLRIVALQWAIYGVFKTSLPLARDFQTNGERLTRICAAVRFLFR